MNKFAAVITMNTDSNRFKAFAANNKHLDFEIYKGISGATVPRDRRIAAGLATEELVDKPDLIPYPIDQYPCGHSRSPMDIMRQG